MTAEVVFSPNNRKFPKSASVNSRVHFLKRQSPTSKLVISARKSPLRVQFSLKSCHNARHLCFIWWQRAGANNAWYKEVCVDRFPTNFRLNMRTADAARTSLDNIHKPQQSYRDISRNLTFVKQSKWLYYYFPIKRIHLNNVYYPWSCII